MNNNENNNSTNNSYDSNQNVTINTAIRTNFDTQNQQVSDIYYSNNQVQLENSNPNSKNYLLAMVAYISGKLLYPVGIFIAAWLIFGGLSNGGVGYYYRTLILGCIAFVILLVITIIFNKNVQMVRTSIPVRNITKIIRLVVAIIVLLYMAITMAFGRDVKKNNQVIFTNNLSVIN